MVLPYCNVSLSVHERMANLMSFVYLNEMPNRMSRLGMPDDHQRSGECLHGSAGTVLPRSKNRCSLSDDAQRLHCVWALTRFIAVVADAASEYDGKRSVLCTGDAITALAAAVEEEESPLSSLMTAGVHSLPTKAMAPPPWPP